MYYTYNPLDKACKSLTGAFPRESEVTFKIFKTVGGEASFSAENCNMCLFRDGEEKTEIPMNSTDDGFTVTLKFHECGLFFYYFKLGEYYLSCGKFHKSELGMTPRAWQITVFSEDYTTPAWMKGGIIYQIFPDRFNRVGKTSEKGKVMRLDWGGTPGFRPNMYGKVLNHDFFGGNLNGIREKLDYLEELGVSVIYLNPIFEAYSNHRYDTGDYMKIDPLLGTVADFDRLIADAKQHGIRIVLDGVFNHTGDDSRYFNKYGKYDSVGAYQSEESPYADWYRFRRFPDEYESWWGIETLPAVNEYSASYQEFIFGENGVLKTWLRHGIGGYRLDVADELPDFFLQKLREAVKETDENAVIIGEVWEDASNKIAYGERREYFQGFELDSVMNYPLKDAIIDFVSTGSTELLRETIAMLIDHYPKTALDCVMNILGTHDTARILTVFGEKRCNNKEEMATARLSEDERRLAKEKVKIAALLQYTLPGVPSLYYGDENGMEGDIDPFCRRCFNWNDMDKDLGGFYRKLGKIRSKLFRDIFADGDYREIFADYSCIIFERKCQNASVLVYVNNSAREYNVSLDGEYYDYLRETTHRNKLLVKAHTYGILSKNK